MPLCRVHEQALGPTRKIPKEKRRRTRKGGHNVCLSELDERRDGGGAYHARVGQGGIVGVTHGDGVWPKPVPAETLEVAVSRLSDHAHLWQRKTYHVVVETPKRVGLGCLCQLRCRRWPLNILRRASATVPSARCRVVPGQNSTRQGKRQVNTAQYTPKQLQSTVDMPGPDDQGMLACLALSDRVFETSSLCLAIGDSAPATSDRVAR